MLSVFVVVMMLCSGFKVAAASVAPSQDLSGKQPKISLQLQSPQADCPLDLQNQQAQLSVEAAGAPLSIAASELHLSLFSFFMLLAPQQDFQRLHAAEITELLPALSPHLRHSILII